MKPPDTLSVTSFSTPAGIFSVALDSSGAIAATAFGGEAVLRRRLGAGAVLQRHDKAGARVRDQVVGYFLGSRKSFDLRLAPAGTPFQKKAWSAIAKIPFGQTRTYGELALSLSSSPRAVGRASGSNPICLIVPCHRVVGSGGALTGFAFGLPLKKKLLEDEARRTAAPLKSR